jgi:WD40 repeat protein
MLKCKQNGVNLEIIKIFDLENDSLNKAIDGQFLFIRCKRAMYKYDLTDMSITSQNVIFKKDGKARNFSICDKYVFLTDFCDLYILDINNLQVIENIRIGKDVSSDLGVIRFDDQNAYINIRNGKMAVMDIDTRTISKFDICDASSWDHCVFRNRIYTGTVNGEIVETDTSNMQLIRKIDLCKKNIYSVVHHDGVLYTVSQDSTIKAVDIVSFETICIAKKAVKGMTKILGTYNDWLVIADGGISLWDKQTLELNKRFDFPTGHFNKGVALYNDILIGSDFQSVYKYKM